MTQEQKSVLTLVAVGDVKIERDDPPSIFRYCGDVFRAADIVFGQIERTLSDRGTHVFKRGTKSPTRNITAFTEQGAGFDVMSHACNHAMDFGWEGFFDTLDIFKKNNIAVVGAGKNIAEARRPAILERGGTKVGFLAYLSIIITELLVAEEDFPGCAPLRTSHFYEQVDRQPGTPPRIITKLFPEDKEAMEEDIKKLRSQVDVLVVSMHCGVHHVPAMIAMYQKEAAYAAIDAGADLVLQHHAHILKGIEVYKGKVIFYGLSNFAAEHKLDSSGKLVITPSIKLRREFHGVKPEPGYEKFPWHMDALKTMITKAYIQDKKIQKVTYIPVFITPNLEPEVVTRKNPRAQEVFDYVVDISQREGLKVSFSWEGDEVLVGEGK